ncbi:MULTISPECIES: carbonic anhydrase [unclassified Amycolatopsis]|uniref:beta-class carbonic anhydrase n=1 Tax=unclassified Amycolatopsis TaxID=2618356 RepID=UPI0034553994
MGEIDALVANAGRYHGSLDHTRLVKRPRRRVAVVACMDARISVYRLLGLEEGDAHVIRNAGGAVTDDAIRSLAVSQRLLGTREIILVHHEDCGMRTFTDTEFARQVEQGTGIRPPWSAEAFTDAEQDVRQCLRRVRSSPFLPHTASVRGFVYDERTGAMTEVGAAGRPD